MSSVFAVRICARTKMVEKARTIRTAIVARIRCLLDRAAGELGVIPKRSFLSRLPARLSGKEIVAIGHADLRETLRIEDVGFFNDVVSIKHVRRRGIDFVRGKRSRFRLRHRAVDEVPNRRGIRDEAEIDFHGLRIPKRYNAAGQTAAVPILSMASSAFLRKDGCALLGRPTSRRQFSSVW